MALDLSNCGTIVAVTGPRPQKLDGDFNGRSSLWAEVRSWYRRFFKEAGADVVISGMALGCDMEAAEVALEDGLDLVAAVPFRRQADRWTAQQQARYHDLLEHAHIAVLFGDAYAAWKLHERNRWMVDHAMSLGAIWTGETEGSGTWSCMDYAQGEGCPVRYLDPLTGVEGTLD